MKKLPVIFNVFAAIFMVIAAIGGGSWVAAYFAFSTAVYSFLLYKSK